MAIRRGSKRSSGLENHKSKKRPTPARRFFSWAMISIRNPDNFPHHLLAYFTMFLVIFAYYAWTESTQGTNALQAQLDVLRADQRPWVYEKSAKPYSSLVVRDNSARLYVLFDLENTGKSPARFVNIVGNLIFRVGEPEEMTADWSACDSLRKRGNIPGGVLFPGQAFTLEQKFEMDEKNMSAWNNLDPGKKNGALLITGCIDYGFGNDPHHHQTKFMYELYKSHLNDPYFGKPPVGEILAKDLTLIAYRFWAVDAD